MNLRALVGILLLAFAAEVCAQEQPAETESLWMPEGYRLLSIEERNALPPEEMKTIGTRNMELLQAAIEVMTPSERQEVQGRLTRFLQTKAAKDYERQYATMVTMRLLAQPQAQEGRRRQEERRLRVEKLVREQEATTRGFPADAAAVQKEAEAILPLIGKEDASLLYLRALRPLRARPWNQDIRRAVARDVRGHDELIEALLEFCAAREKESPEEGAWFSLEAFVRLTMRDDEAAGRRLFAVAVQKNARDLDSRIFPLLLAEIDGDQAAVARLRPRALEAWPNPAHLDQTLFAYVQLLPPMLQAKAHDTIEARFTQANPADWGARLDRLWVALEDNPHDLRRKERLPEIAREAESVLVLPATILPQEYGVQFQAIALLVYARLGRCDEVEAHLPALEQGIASAAPLLYEEGQPPPPRTAEDVRELREDLAEIAAFRSKLDGYLKTGSLKSIPELRDVPEAERRATVEAAIAELDRVRGDDLRLLGSGGNDAAVAAAWTREDRIAWEKARKVDAFPQYDIPTKADRIRIRVRSAEGRCLLEQGQLDRAIRVLQPCFGDARNIHYACVQPLIDAGILRANKGDTAAALRIFRLLQPLLREESGLNQLRAAIERVAPGSLPTSVPSSAPTPPRPVA